MSTRTLENIILQQRILCKYICVYVCNVYKCMYMYNTINREYFVSKIFRIFIFRMYKFSYVHTLLFTNTVYSKYPFIFEFLYFVRILLYENLYSTKFPELWWKCLSFIKDLCTQSGVTLLKAPLHSKVETLVLSAMIDSHHKAIVRILFILFS